MREPCPLPLVALRGDETCPRCGRPAREHRGHPTYQEETMGETTEPTREQIIEAIDGLANDTDAPQWIKDLEDEGAFNDWSIAVMRLALRTLDAEAKLAERDRYIAEQRAITEPSVQDLARQLREATERAEKAERELADVSDECATLRTEHVRMRSALVSAEARAEKAERERDEARGDLESMTGLYNTAWPALDSARAERNILRAKLADAEAKLAKVQKDAETILWNLAGCDTIASSGTPTTFADSMARPALHAVNQMATRLADAERRIAELSPPTTDERLDCESSSLLLLSTWARRVMMRPKNRAKQLPPENIRTLLWMARDELYEAYSAFADGFPTDDILAELGDAAAYIAFAMREIESRRNR